MHLKLDGDVPSQKNSKRILTNRRNGAPFIASNERVTAWKQYAVLTLRRQSVVEKITSYPVAIRLAFTFGTNRRHDLDNAASGVMDALVQAAVIPDDSVGYVSSILLIYNGVSREPGVEIRIDGAT